MNRLDAIRQQKDQFFRIDPHSPLTPEQRRDFRGLNYFPENLELCLDVEVEEFAQKDEIDMETTGGYAQTYERYGRFRFTVDGQPAELTIYHGPHGFFLPFVDALAATETYGAGRYLEPEPIEGGKFRVDFNEAYNPYCAYNENWSCPITPAENRLKVAIRAGEKTFHP
jgi:uncharacterized protein